jgi:hypothetical protein
MLGGCFPFWSRHPVLDVYLLPELRSAGYAWETWEDEATPQLLDEVGQWGAARGVTIGDILVSRGDDEKLAAGAELPVLYRRLKGVDC